jgi:hypothetical protein
MAKLPPLKRLMFPVDNDPQRLFTALNSFFQNVFQALDGQLEFGQNVKSLILELQVVGGEALVLANPMDRPPIGCLVLQTIGEGVTAAVQPLWQQSGNDIVISAFTGLTAGNNYTIRVLFI